MRWGTCTRLVRQTFNPLLEIPLAIRRGARRRKNAFNPLLEIHMEHYSRVRLWQVLSFNPLLEIPSHRGAVFSPGRQRQSFNPLLEIRRGTPATPRTSSRGLSFNPLLEIHNEYVCERQYQHGEGLSILFLRFLRLSLRNSWAA